MPRHEKTHRQVRRTMLPEERILRISFAYLKRERIRATKSVPGGAYLLRPGFGTGADRE